LRRISLITAAMACILAFMGGLLTGGVLGEPAQDSVLWAAPEGLEEEELDDGGLVSLLLRTIEIISQRSVHPVDEKELLWGAIEGVISSLDDPYAEMLEREDLDAMMEEYRNQEYSGIGIRIAAAPEGARVLQVFAGGPAAQAGVWVGDVIIEVDGESIGEKSLDEIASLIRGEPGTPVEILLLRDDDKVGPLSVEREEVVRPTLTHERIELEGRDLGYIAIGRFAESTPDEMERALERLEGVEGLLVDVRGNPGGILSAAISVCEYLVPEGPILLTEGRDGEVISEFESETPGVDAPVMMLMDEFTASGAEILAGAVRDRLDSMLVGVDTFGKGSVQSVFNLDEAGLRLTTAEFVLPSGHRIAEHGLTPDVQIVRTAGVSPGAVHVPDEPLNPGDSGHAVLHLADRLRELGYLDEVVGAQYDSNITRAVAGFQRDEGLGITGRADEHTLRRLGERSDSWIDPLIDYLQEDVSEEILEKEWLLQDRQRLQALRALVGWMLMY